MRRVQVGEVAAPAAGDADLLADLLVVVDEHDAPSALPRGRGAHHAGRAGTDHGDLEARGGHGRRFCLRQASAVRVRMMSARRAASRPGNSAS